MHHALLLLPDFALILCGWLVCRYTALNRTVWQQVDSLVYYFLFPVLLFHSVVRSPLDLASASRLIAAGLLLAASAIALSWSLPRWPWLGRHLAPREHAAAAQVAFRFNSFVALAIIERLAGPQSALLLAVLIGVCVPIYNVAAVWPMARGAPGGVWRELARNPLIVATVSGMAFNLLGLRLPGWLEPTTARIAGTAIVLGLLAAGAGMRLAALADNRALTVAVLAIRHLLSPLVAALLARLLALDAAQATALLVFAAVPTAASSYVLATRMGYNGAYVGGLVTLSTLLGMASVPLALALRP